MHQRNSIKETNYEFINVNMWSAKQKEVKQWKGKQKCKEDNRNQDMQCVMYEYGGF